MQKTARIVAHAAPSFRAAQVFEEKETECSDAGIDGALG
jgi:hypothetical protein